MKPTKCPRCARKFNHGKGFFQYDATKFKCGNCSFRFEFIPANAVNGMKRKDVRNEFLTQ
jgi:transposase-like protein